MSPNGGPKQNTGVTTGQRKRKLSSDALLPTDGVSYRQESDDGKPACSSFAVTGMEAMPSSSRQSVVQKQLQSKVAMRRFAEASKFSYFKKLLGHRSCINTIAFSRGEGRWLADAGDDLKIFIRDVLEGPGQATAQFPVLQLHGHASNIFSLSWSAQNKYLYSAGNDGRIFQYDLEHSSIPVLDPSRTRPERRACSDLEVIGSHYESIPEVSSHPTNAHLLLSCDDNGKLKLIDTRMPQPCVALQASAQAAFASVQWNPNEADGNTFAAATASPISGSTRLYDVRRCFSSSQGSKLLTAKDALVDYHIDLLQNSRSLGCMSGKAETNSVCFDPTGRMLASSLSRFSPTLYAVGDPDPLALLESVQKDNSGLKSCCTIKHGSFGFDAQLGKLHYAIGSDDFRAYVFEIPDIETLKNGREIVNLSTWIQETTQDHQARKREMATLRQHANESNSSPKQQNASADQVPSAEEEAEGLDLDSEILYTQGPPSHCQNVVRPMTINKPAFILKGAASIVNVTAFHPTLNWIATAGIENCVRLYSSAPFIYSKRINRRYHQTDTTRVRTMPTNEPALSDLQDSDTEDTSDEDDTTTSSYHNGDPEYDLLVGDSDFLSDDEDDDVESAGDDDVDSQDDDLDVDGEEVGASQHQHHTVHDFLAAMRTDPLFAGPPLSALDDEGSESITQNAHLTTAARSPATIHGSSDHHVTRYQTQTQNDIDTELEEWTTDGEVECLASLGKKFDFFFRHGYASMYSRHERWAHKKEAESAMAESRRTTLFDQILHHDEKQHVVDNFLGCSLNLPPDTP